MANSEQDLPGLAIIDDNDENSKALEGNGQKKIHSLFDINILVKSLPLSPLKSASCFLSLRELRAMHGADSVVLSDIVRPDDELLQKGRLWYKTQS